MASVDIVIPHFGAEGLLTTLCLQCLKSIRDFTTDYRLVFIDNASPEFGDLEAELAHHPHLLIRETENLGFVKAVNHGLAATTAPHVVILNNDTMAVEGWIPSMLEGFRKLPVVGLVGPLTNAKKSWQGNWKPTIPRGLSSPARVHILAPGRMLAFFCVMLSRAVLEKVGPLDESYGVGFGDDDDYCRRAERAGFKMALIQSLTIPHYHRSTFKALYAEEEIVAMQSRALAKFHREK